uniref:NPC1 middle luminal domain-containing protein n=1 Tax=Timema poppense TaxID=170557 RepID=A0A7R9CRV3_TIMPO|nr:unnamed protein product [Timema poppensis]
MTEAYENKITASLNLMAMFDKVKEAQDNPSDPLRLQLTQSFTQELTVSYLRGEGSDDVRHAVGQRLAGINHSRIALGADEEESPLQSKRSSVVSADEAMLSHRDTGRDASFFQRLGAGTDSLMERGFYSWGLVCASRPWLILFLGLCTIVGLGHGIKYMKMTTDPVELWASPHSRARVEREFFDSHFEPFYRTEQVIISAVGLPPRKRTAMLPECVEVRREKGGDGAGTLPVIHRTRNFENGPGGGSGN